MPQVDLILLRPPGIYDFRDLTLLHIPRNIASSNDSSDVNRSDFLAIAIELTKAGRRVRIIDLPFRMARNKRFNVDSFIKKLQSPVFVVELNDISQARGALEAVELIKKHHPLSRIIFCGCTSASFYEEVAAFSQVYAVIQGALVGAAAEQLIEIATNSEPGRVPDPVWMEKGGRVIRNEFSVEPASANLDITEYYRFVASQILHFRDFDGAFMLRNQLLHPRVSIFKSVYALPPTFRDPDDVYTDIVEMCRFSPTPIAIAGDIRMPGEHFAERLLSLLQHRPIANWLNFELAESASSFYIQELARASPGFLLRMAPGSHDTSVRKTLGYSYSNKDLESTIEASIRARARGIEISFLSGLPGQNAKSVLESMDYCEYLLRRFDGDRRLSLRLSPCFPTCGSASCGSPENYAFIPRFHTFEDYHKIVTLPGWCDRLGYRTAEMSSREIALTTYEALIRIARLRAKYGQLPDGISEDRVMNYSRGMEMTERLSKLEESGSADELASLRPEIDRINRYEAEPFSRPGFPLMLSRPQNLVALWNALLHYQADRH